MIYKHKLFFLTIDPEPVLDELSTPMRKDMQ